MELIERAEHELSLMAAALLPPSNLTVSEWSDNNRFLRSTTSQETGKWRTNRFPFNKEILDCLSTNSPVQEITHMKAAQVGATDGATCWLGYIIDQEPGPAMAVEPTVDLVKKFSTTRFTPMVTDAPCLKGKIKDAKSRDGGNTILSKEFPGGIITFAGANSAAGLRHMSVRYLFLDEVDAYPDDVEGEGDPIDLATARTRNFSRRKVYKASTPTISGVSRIEADYEDSDKRKYFVPCPGCGHMHVLEWENFKYKNANGKLDPQNARMICPACGLIIEEHNKTYMLEHGEWRATNPEYPDKLKRGYHISALYSPIGFYSWADIAKQWIKAQKDTKRLKTFVNTVLGECWEDDHGESIEPNTLESRRQYYGLREDKSLIVPNDVLMITAAVDIQDAWLEYEVVGWGVDKKSWGIETHRLMGDLQKKQIWSDLDNILKRTWIAEDGCKLNITCACIDSGFLTSEVYAFVKGKENRRIFAIKGKGGLGVPLVGKHTRTNRANIALFPIGDDTGKETVLNRLKVLSEDEEGYCHFPREQQFGYDEDYFRGITSEKRVIKYHMGKPHIEWIKKSGARNEPLDIRKYATAALEIANPNYDFASLIKNRHTVRTNKPVIAPRHRGVISKGVDV